MVRGNKGLKLENGEETRKERMKTTHPRLEEYSKIFVFHHYFTYYKAKVSVIRSSLRTKSKLLLKP
jgi:hypothetical protein